MKKLTKKLKTLTGLFLITVSLFAQGTYEDYQRAEKLLNFNMWKLARNIKLTPHWIDKTSDFWYQNQLAEGHEFYVVYSNKNEVKPAFDHEKLAKALETKIGKEVKADSLPFSRFSYIDNRMSIKFRVDTFNLECELKNYNLTDVKSKPNGLEKNESKSPDGKWIISVKDYNLFIKSTKTGEETQLTSDGIAKYEYATPLSWYKLIDESNGDVYDPSIDITWSSDSKKFVTFKMDRRDVEKLYMYQSLTEDGMRAKVWSYERPLPGEKAHQVEFYVFDVQTKENVKVDIEPCANFLTSVDPAWTKDDKSILFSKFSRGYKSYDIYLINPEDGSSHVVVHDESKTMIEGQMVHSELINNGEKVLYTSERDGWNHIYLFDGETGDVINQVTKGEFVVRGINYVDEKNEQIYFMAGGDDKSRNPYYQHLYRINFDGTEMTLLTPENAEHAVRISPDKKYFTDTYSRVDQKPKGVLRQLSDGKVVREIIETNIDKISATGWKFPERFKVKARDGVTDLYGVLYYPSNFDATKKYPIIDNSYTGPQAVNIPRSFGGGIWNQGNHIAEAGFIVMVIDGMGTAMRSKAFHDVSYENLGDIGAPDHIGAMKQLAEKYPFIDLERVGIFGFSAGGYDAAHALLAHPEFYKVGVAAAGNHDHGMAKAWWPEQYMGMPGDHYIEQSNLTLAKNLEGKLLLAHGDMDNNVNPACTYRLAGELIKHNKDFDLLIIPNHNHGELASNLYYLRKRLDYFVKHLLGVEPPKEFEFKKY